jgi:hypothetical protein
MSTDIASVGVLVASLDPPIGIMFFFQTEHKNPTDNTNAALQNLGPAKVNANANAIILISPINHFLP